MIRLHIKSITIILCPFIRFFISIYQEWVFSAGVYLSNTHRTSFTTKTKLGFQIPRNFSPYRCFLHLGQSQSVRKRQPVLKGTTSFQTFTRFATTTTIFFRFIFFLKTAVWNHNFARFFSFIQFWSKRMDWEGGGAGQPFFYTYSFKRFSKRLSFPLCMEYTTKCKTRYWFFLFSEEYQIYVSYSKHCCSPAA